MAESATRSVEEVTTAMRSFASQEVGEVRETTGTIDHDGLNLLYVMTMPRERMLPWGIVVCPSMFEFSRFQPTELMFLRRAAAMGFPGIYVEPPGMGDSQGRFENLTVDERVRTALSAFESLKGHVDTSVSPCWFGARLGSSVAMLAADRAGPRSALIAWDPVADGATYWAQTRRLARITALAQRQRSFRDPDVVLEEADRATVLWLPVDRQLVGDLNHLDDATINTDSPTLLLAINDKMLTRVRERFVPAPNGVELVSLGRDKVDHLGVSEASEAIEPTLTWLSRKLK